MRTRTIFRHGYRNAITSGLYGIEGKVVNEVEPNKALTANRLVSGLYGIEGKVVNEVEANKEASTANSLFSGLGIGVKAVNEVEANKASTANSIFSGLYGIAGKVLTEVEANKGNAINENSLSALQPVLAPKTPITTTDSDIEEAKSSAIKGLLVSGAAALLLKIL